MADAQAADALPADALPAPKRGRDVEILLEVTLLNGARLCVARGDITTYAAPNACVVNAANRKCQGGGGVDYAITKAGGDALAAARRALKRIAPGVSRDRCATGDAVRTGPAPGGGPFGKLGVAWVVHAVGPDYNEEGFSHDESDQLLRSAYAAAVREASGCATAAAFPLLSAAIFRGKRDLGGLLDVSVDALAAAIESSPLREVLMIAYRPKELDALLAAVGRAERFRDRPT